MKEVRYVPKNSQKLPVDFEDFFSFMQVDAMVRKKCFIFSENLCDGGGMSTGYLKQFIFAKVGYIDRVNH